jgi:hypothetical protein
MELNRILSSELRENGSLITHFVLSDQIRQYVQGENWESVDYEFYQLTRPNGQLFQFLSQYHAFSSIEFTIAIRDSQNPDEEDGIWHDDGSRLIAASLSLTLNPNIEGGVLEIKNKLTNKIKKYQCPSFGEMVVFLTGEYGYLHKINKVTKGKRIIVVLWCNS